MLTKMTPAVFVHAGGTTGRDATARRRFSKDRRCAQCRADDGTMVAAHVVAYPWFNCCVGFMTLKTTCAACNQVRRAEKKPRFVGAYTAANPQLSRWFCWPCCVPYDPNEHDDARLSPS